MRAAVLDAADQLLSGDLEPITVKHLSEVSGVSEPTLYRRWRTAENILLDAAVRHLSEESPVPVTGELRADLVTWASGLERSIATKAGLRFLSLIVQARSAQPDASAEALAPLMNQRFGQLRSLLETAGAPASLTVEGLLDRVLAPLYVRQLLGYAPESGAAELVDEVLDRAHRG
ncbi:TetR/AcrR family transcriptional regulator [Amycolatopsis ultiminotia]|uniref:TetR/AcrR family transcriptional regulator n=1 Tax=Amycolatopsis ultiminotia TaxID=543629 RepID=A0ABP6WC91_9PSEU